MKLMTSILAVTALLCSQVAVAQMQGPMYQINVRGLPMNCTAHTGQPVAIFLNSQLNDIGMANYYNGAPVIILNPRVASQYSNMVAQWWFAHECAHHALPPQFNNETYADCYAVQQLVRNGVIRRREQLIAFSQELGALPGSPMGHLPGPYRVRNIINCASS